MDEKKKNRLANVSTKLCDQNNELFSYALALIRQDSKTWRTSHNATPGHLRVSEHDSALDTSKCLLGCVTAAKEKNFQQWVKVCQSMSKSTKSTGQLRFAPAPPGFASLHWTCKPSRARSRPCLGSSDM